MLEVWFPENVTRGVQPSRHSAESGVGRRGEEKKIHLENESTSEMFIKPSVLLVDLIISITCLTKFPSDITVLQVTFIIESYA